MLNVVIIGSRDFKNKELLDITMKKLQEHNTVKKIISGGAKCADTIGIQWANKNNIETLVFYPDFKKHKKAYHFRNRQIVMKSDLIVAFWNGYSTGTKYTINFAKNLEKEVIIVKY